MADTSPLVELSDALAAAVAKAGASTVTVNARRRIPASGIAWAAGGIIVTADHVIERDENITITLPDGTQVAAAVAGRDPGSDIAVLRAQATNLPAAERGKPVKPGNLVLAVGRPGDTGPMASLGVVGAVGGPWRTFRGGHVGGYIRTDTTFYPGFSGGPLVAADGSIVGLNSSRLGRGAGLTVPIDAVATIVDALLASGKIKRGYLGVGSQVTRLPAALATKAGGQETGLLIVGVDAGSPADKGGVLIGDILVAMDGSKVKDTDDLQALLGPESVGKEAKLTVLRGGEPASVTVTVGERS